MDKNNLNDNRTKDGCSRIHSNNNSISKHNKIIKMKKPKTIKFTEADKEALYRKAFNDARQDLEETRKDDIEERAEEISAEKLTKMLSVVDPNSIVTFDSNHGLIFIGGKKADDVVLSNLKSEADFLMSSSLWKLLCNTPRELAQRFMFVSAETLDDIRNGKSMLYTLSTQQKIIDTFRSYIPRKK